MTPAWPQLALDYNREIRAARRRARFALACKLLIAMATGLTLAAGITEGFRQVIVIQLSQSEPWKG